MAGIGRYSRKKLEAIIDERSLRNAVEANGDITSVAAGAGLSGGASSGRATLSIDYTGADSIVKSATDGTDITVATDDKLLIVDESDNSDTVKYINISQLPGSSVTPAGSTTHIQYNSNGSLGASANLSFDGTTLTVVGAAIFSGSTSNGTFPVEFVNSGESGEFLRCISPDGNPAIDLNQGGSGNGYIHVYDDSGNSRIQLDGDTDPYLQFKDSSGNVKGLVKYSESSSDYLTISGSANGLALSGSHISVDGKIGIGVSAADIEYAIQLPNNNDSTGKMRARAYTSYSSRRYKRNIKKIDNPIKIIQSLEGVSYDWKGSGCKDYGFIAEDVGKILPSIVQWEENGKDATGLDYLKIISFLVEAVKEQQKQIDTISKEFFMLKSK